MKKSKNGLGVTLLVIVVVLIIIGIVYFSSGSGASTSQTTTSVAGVTSAPVTVSTTVQDPKQAFFSLRAKLDAAPDITTYENTLLAGTDAAEQAQVKTTIDNLIKTDGSSALATIRSTEIPTNTLVVTGETFNSNSVTIIASFMTTQNGAQIKGVDTITMKLEGGSWKEDRESVEVDK